MAKDTDTSIDEKAVSVYSSALKKAGGEDFSYFLLRSAFGHAESRSFPRPNLRDGEGFGYFT